MDNETIKNELKLFLQSKGVMQKKISEACGMSRTTVSFFINGKRNISYKNLLAIHQYIIANE